MTNQETLTIQGKSIQPGEIVDMGGFPEMYFLPDSEQNLKIASMIMNRVHAIGLSLGKNLGNTQEGFKFVLHNPAKQEYIAITVSPVGQSMDNAKNIYRHIEMYVSDGMSLDGDFAYAQEDNNTTYSLTSPELIFIDNGRYHTQIFPTYTRAYIDRDKDQSILRTATSIEATNDILEVVKGIAVDPFKILYEHETEGAIIKTYLGPEAIVDTEAKRVVVIESREFPSSAKLLSKELDYNDTLLVAREALSKGIWGSHFSNLARRLKQKTQTSDNVE